MKRTIKDDKNSTFKTLEDALDNGVTVLKDNAGDILIYIEDDECWIYILSDFISIIENTEEINNEYSLFKEFKGKVVLDFRK